MNGRNAEKGGIFGFLGFLVAFMTFTGMRVPWAIDIMGIARRLARWHLRGMDQDMLFNGFVSRNALLYIYTHEGDQLHCDKNK